MLCLCFPRFFLCHTYINIKEKKEYQLTVFFSLLLSIIRSDACSFFPIPFFFQRVVFACWHKLRFFPYTITRQSRKHTIEKREERETVEL